jgi:acid phosphatase type 7
MGVHASPAQVRGSVGGNMRRMRRALLAVVLLALLGVASPAQAAPAAPRSLQANVLRSSIVLTWYPSADKDVVGYRVYRRNADGSWPQSPGTYQTEAPLQFDPRRVPLHLYMYRVTAVDASGAESPMSNPSAAATGEDPNCEMVPPLGITSFDLPQPEMVHGTYGISFQAHVANATSVSFWVNKGDTTGREQFIGTDHQPSQNDPNLYALAGYVNQAGYQEATVEAIQDFNVAGASVRCTMERSANFRIDDPPERPGDNNPCTSCDSVEAQLSDLISGVTNHPNSSMTRHVGVTDQTHDCGGLECPMEDLKIITDPRAPASGGRYLGVYRAVAGGSSRVRLAWSDDLAEWSFTRNLASQASHPTIIRDLTPDGFYVAYEKLDCAQGGSCLVVEHYANAAALEGGVPDQSTLELPRTQAPSSGCEGTPNFYKLTPADPNVDPFGRTGPPEPVITIGFHYNEAADCSGLSRQAIGRLTLTSGSLELASWVTSKDRNANKLLLHSPVLNGSIPSTDPNTRANDLRGHIGDRDSIVFKGRAFSVIEAQRVPGDPATWSTYLFDREDNTIFKLGVRSTPVIQGLEATAFKNPTLSDITVPDGTPDGARAIASTYFIPSQGATPGQEMVMWKKYDSNGNCYWADCSPPQSDPVIAAAGDIACAAVLQENGQPNPNYKNGDGDDAHCAQGFTAGLVWDPGLSKVLALGDNQYEGGSRADFRAVFDNTWGIVKPAIAPTPGNHEYAFPRANGYFAYFNGGPQGPPGPNQTGLAGDPARGYYALPAINNWLIIGINSGGSNCGGGLQTGPGCGATSAQVSFLRDQLNGQDPSSCVLVYWHHPRFMAGGQDTSLQHVWDAISNVEPAKRPDLVLNGHQHSYQRSNRLGGDGFNNASGIREIIVGTGGKDLHAAGQDLTQWPVVDNSAFGVLRVTLHSNSYDWRFVPKAGSSFTDGGRDSCHST